MSQRRNARRNHFLRRCFKRRRKHLFLLGLDLAAQRRKKRRNLRACSLRSLFLREERPFERLRLFERLFERLFLLVPCWSSSSTSSVEVLLLLLLLLLGTTAGTGCCSSSSSCESCEDSPPVQGLVSARDGQASPPSLGACTMVRVRVVAPSRQRPQSLQGETTQSTAQLPSEHSRSSSTGPAKNTK